MTTRLRFESFTAAAAGLYGYRGYFYFAPRAVEDSRVT